MDWFIKSKAWEWIFSGIGVAVASAIVAWFLARKRRQTTAIEKMTAKPEADKISIQADGDVSFAKDHGKSVQVKDSQIGVIGDNAQIKGGIHFENHNKPSGKKP
jgi:hypothetical protein